MNSSKELIKALFVEVNPKRQRTKTGQAAPSSSSEEPELIDISDEPSPQPTSSTSSSNPKRSRAPRRNLSENEKQLNEIRVIWGASNRTMLTMTPFLKEILLVLYGRDAVDKMKLPDAVKRNNEKSFFENMKRLVHIIETFYTDLETIDMKLLTTMHPTIKIPIYQFIKLVKDYMQVGQETGRTVLQEWILDTLDASKITKTTADKIAPTLNKLTNQIVTIGRIFNDEEDEEDYGTRTIVEEYNVVGVMDRFKLPQAPQRYTTLLDQEEALCNKALTLFWKKLSSDDPDIMGHLTTFLEDPSRVDNTYKGNAGTPLFFFRRNLLVCYKKIMSVWVGKGKSDELFHHISRCVENLEDNRNYRSVYGLTDQETRNAFLKSLYITTVIRLTTPTKAIVFPIFSIYAKANRAFFNEQLAGRSYGILTSFINDNIDELTEAGLYHPDLTNQFVKLQDHLEIPPSAIRNERRPPTTVFPPSPASSSSDSDSEEEIESDYPALNESDIDSGSDDENTLQDDDDDDNSQTNVEREKQRDREEQRFIDNLAFLLFLREMFLITDPGLSAFFTSEQLFEPTFLPNLRVHVSSVQTLSPHLHALLKSFVLSHHENILAFITAQFSITAAYMFTLARCIINHFFDDFTRFSYDPTSKDPNFRLFVVGRMMHIHGAFSFNRKLFINAWDEIHGTYIGDDPNRPSIMEIIRTQYPEMARVPFPERIIISPSIDRANDAHSIESLKRMLLFKAKPEHINQLKTRPLSWRIDSEAEYAPAYDMYNASEGKYPSIIVIADRLRNSYFTNVIRSPITYETAFACIWEWWSYQLRAKMESISSQYPYLDSNVAWVSALEVLNTPYIPDEEGTHRLPQRVCDIITVMRYFLPQEDFDALTEPFRPAALLDDWYYSYPAHLVQGLQPNLFYEAMIDRPPLNLNRLKQFLHAFIEKYELDDPEFDKNTTSEQYLLYFSYQYNKTGVFTPIISNWLRSITWYSVFPDLNYKAAEVASFVRFIRSINAFHELETKADMSNTLKDIEVKANNVREASTMLRDHFRVISKEQVDIPLSIYAEIIDEYQEHIKEPMPVELSLALIDINNMNTEDRYIVSQPNAAPLPFPKWNNNSCALDSMIAAFFVASYQITPKESSFYRLYQNRLAVFPWSTNFLTRANTNIYSAANTELLAMRDGLNWSTRVTRCENTGDVTEEISDFLQFNFEELDVRRFQVIPDFNLDTPVTDEYFGDTFLSNKDGREYIVVTDSARRNNPKLLYAFKTHSYVLNAVILNTGDASGAKVSHFTTAIFMTQQTVERHDVQLSPDYFLENGMYLVDAIGRGSSELFKKRTGVYLGSPINPVKLCDQFPRKWDVINVRTIFNVPQNSKSGKNIPTAYIYKRSFLTSKNFQNLSAASPPPLLPSSSSSSLTVEQPSTSSGYQSSSSTFVPASPSSSFTAPQVPPNSFNPTSPSSSSSGYQSSSSSFIPASTLDALKPIEPPQNRATLNPPPRSFKPFVTPFSHMLTTIPASASRVNAPPQEEFLNEFNPILTEGATELTKIFPQSPIETVDENGVLHLEPTAIYSQPPTQASEMSSPTIPLFNTKKPDLILLDDDDDDDDPILPPTQRIVIDPILLNGNDSFLSDDDLGGVPLYQTLEHSSSELADTQPMHSPSSLSRLQAEAEERQRTKRQEGRRRLARALAPSQLFKFSVATQPAVLPPTNVFSMATQPAQGLEDDVDELDMSNMPTTNLFSILAQAQGVPPPKQQPSSTSRPSRRPAPPSNKLVDDDDEPEIVKMVDPTGIAVISMISLTSKNTTPAPVMYPEHMTIIERIREIPLFTWDKNSCGFDAIISAVLPTAILYPASLITSPELPVNPYRRWIDIIEQHVANNTAAIDAIVKQSPTYAAQRMAINDHARRSVDMMHKVKDIFLNSVFEKEIVICKAKHRGGLDTDVTSIFPYIFQKVFTKDHFTYDNVTFPNMSTYKINHAKPLPNLFKNGAIPSEILDKHPNVLFLRANSDQDTKAYSEKIALPKYHIHKDGAVFLLTSVVMSATSESGHGRHFYTIIFADKLYPYYTSPGTTFKNGVWVMDAMDGSHNHRVPRVKEMDFRATPNAALTVYGNSFYEPYGTHAAPVMWVYAFIGMNIKGRQKLPPNMNIQGPLVSSQVDMSVFVHLPPPRHVLGMTADSGSLPISISDDREQFLKTGITFRNMITQMTHGHIVFMSMIIDFFARHLKVTGVPGMTPEIALKMSYSDFFNIIENTFHQQGYFVLAFLLKSHLSYTDNYIRPAYLEVYEMFIKNPHFLNDGRLVGRAILMMANALLVGKKSDKAVLTASQKINIVYTLNQMLPVFVGTLSQITNIERRTEIINNILYLLRITHMQIMLSETLYHVRIIVMDMFVGKPLAGTDTNFFSILDLFDPSTHNIQDKWIEVCTAFGYVISSPMAHLVYTPFVASYNFYSMYEDLQGHIPVNISLLRPNTTEAIEYLAVTMPQTNAMAFPPLRVDANLINISNKIFKMVNQYGLDKVIETITAQSKEELIKHVDSQWPFVFTRGVDLSVILYMYAYLYENSPDALAAVVRPNSIGRMVTNIIDVLAKIISDTTHSGVFVETIKITELFAIFFYLTKFNGRSFLKEKSIKADSDPVCILSIAKNPLHNLLPATFFTFLLPSLQAINASIRDNLHDVVKYGSFSHHTSIFSEVADDYTEFQTMSGLFEHLWNTIKISPLNVLYSHSVTRVTVHILSWLADPQFLQTPYVPIVRDRPVLPPSPSSDTNPSPFITYLMNKFHPQAIEVPNDDSDNDDDDDDFYALPKRK